jgi:hypothetical protein
VEGIEKDETFHLIRIFGFIPSDQQAAKGVAYEQVRRRDGGDGKELVEVDDGLGRVVGRDLRGVGPAVAEPGAVVTTNLGEAGDFWLDLAPIRAGSAAAGLENNDSAVTLAGAGKKELLRADVPEPLIRLRSGLGPSYGYGCSNDGEQAEGSRPM